MHTSSVVSNENFLMLACPCPPTGAAAAAPDPSCCLLLLLLLVLLGAAAAAATAATATTATNTTATNTTATNTTAITTTTTVRSPAPHARPACLAPGLLLRWHLPPGLGWEMENADAAISSWGMLDETTADRARATQRDFRFSCSCWLAWAGLTACLGPHFFFMCAG